MTQSPPGAVFPPALMLEKLLGTLTSVCVQVAVSGLGIADLLAGGPVDIDDLAKRCGADRDVLLLFLRSLTSESIFQEVEPGVFAHTEQSQCLRSDAPFSLRGIADMLQADWAAEVWRPESLLHTLRTGQPAFEHVFGQTFWEYLATHPQADASFSRAQTIFSGPMDDAIVEAYPFTGIKTVVDVGGGEGTFLVKVLRRNPDLAGILFDRSAVVGLARPQLAALDIADRLSCVAGDFFESVPRGGDAYVLKQVLIDWGDEQAIRILTNCRTALAPGGRILIAAYLVPEPPERPLKYLMAGLWVRLNCPGGYERTLEQFRSLTDRAGLRIVRVLPTASTHSVLEIVPVE